MKASSFLFIRPVLLRMRVMAWLTVDSEVWSMAAISLLVYPKAQNLAISRSAVSRWTARSTFSRTCPASRAQPVL